MCKLVDLKYIMTFAKEENFCTFWLQVQLAFDELATSEGLLVLSSLRGGVNVRWTMPAALLQAP